MPPFGPNELIVIRHAPADHQGRLCGRTDVPAFLPKDEELRALAAALEDATPWASPALRCQETATALFPHHAVAQDERLWEQHFGKQEGMRFEDLPDLGPLSLEALASVKASGGESFLDMVNRVEPALQDLAQQARRAGPVAVVAHAGTARAALGIALGPRHIGLGFEIAPLSITRLRCFEGGFSVIATNQTSL